MQLMAELRSREWIAIAALAVAVLIAFSFCNPAAGRDEVHRPISHGETIPSLTTPQGTATPTPIPATDLATPVNWFLRYLTSAQPGRGVEDSFGFLETLDIAHDAAPYPGLHDDDWVVTASATWELPAGRYAFTIERDCEISIAVDDIEVRGEPDASGPDHLRVVFDHEGGKLQLVITAIDRDGPFLLRWA
jgi:hypothetical protein